MACGVQSPGGGLAHGAPHHTFALLFPGAPASARVVVLLLEAWLLVFSPPSVRPIARADKDASLDEDAPDWRANVYVGAPGSPESRAVIVGGDVVTWRVYRATAHAKLSNSSAAFGRD